MNPAKNAIREMRDLMSEYREFGASDSEPRREFSQLLHDHLDGCDVSVPITAEQWRLFSDMPGADDAARALRDKAVDVLRIVDGDRRGVAEAMRHYF